MKHPFSIGLALGLLAGGLLCLVVINWFQQDNGAVPLAEAAIRSTTSSTNTTASPSPRTSVSSFAEAPADGLGGKGMETHSEFQKKVVAVLETPDSNLRIARLRVLLEGLTAAEAPHVLRLIKAQDPFGRTSLPELELFLAHWGGADPTALLAWAQKQPNKSAQDWVVACGMDGWAKVDPQAAVAWLNDHPESEHWEWGLESFMKSYGTVDPAGAMQSVRDILNVDDSHRRLRWNILSSLTESVSRLSGAPGLRDWFQSQPAGTDQEIFLKREAQRHVAERLLRANAKEGLNWLAELPASPWLNSSAYDMGAEKLAQTSPNAALDWLGKLPGVDQRLGWGKGREIFRNWRQADPTSASEWLKQNAGRFAEGISQER